MPDQTEQSVPQWQPSSTIFTMGTMIDGLLAGAYLVMERCPTRAKVGSNYE